MLAVLAGGGYLVVRAFAPEIAPVLTGSGCLAAGDHQSILLDTQQGSIAATIAGVAHQQAMPRVAVTIAYAAAMQESKLHNLSYGDRDSVGVFQQRPSEGWGPRKDLQDPIYASTKFFRALKTIPGYRKMPVSQAAQAVQHSADGAAYTQYTKMAAAMTPAFTGQRGHAVYCWSGPASRRSANVSGITSGLGTTFGPVVSGEVTDPRDSRGSADGRSAKLQVQIRQPRLGWEVATWLVTHASTYRIHQIRFAGYQWRATASSKGWGRDAGAPPAGRLELS